MNVPAPDDGQSHPSRSRFRAQGGLAIRPEAGKSPSAPWPPPAVLGLPIVQRGFRNPVLACQVGRLCSQLMFLQDRYDLLLPEP